MRVVQTEYGPMFSDEETNVSKMKEGMKGLNPTGRYEWNGSEWKEASKEVEAPKKDGDGISIILVCVFIGAMLGYVLGLVSGSESDESDQVKLLQAESRDLLRENTNLLVDNESLKEQLPQKKLRYTEEPTQIALTTEERQDQERVTELSECRRLREKYGGECEVKMPDGSRCDILTGEYAIEADWDHKWSEAIGQANLYSIWTGKKPAVLILVKNKEKAKLNLLRCKMVCEKVGIKLFLEDSPVPKYRPGT